MSFGRWYFTLLVQFVWIVVLVNASAVSHSPQNQRNQEKLVRGGSLDVNSGKIFRRFSEDSIMPSLFSKQEDVYDRYAACLAATEGLRRIRDRDMLVEVEAQKRGTSRATSLSEIEKHITAKYVQNSIKVLRALGMPVNQFNELGRLIAKDADLKQKVLEQAYLYRMAATIKFDRTPLIEDPGSVELLRGAVPRDKIQLFSESLTEIEQLRADQLRRLTKSLHVDKFPEHVNISDPNLLPFLSPKVRAVVEAFPLQAEAIVKKHGLQSDEFNKMLEETKRNPMFRWKIQKQIRTEQKPTTQSSSPETAQEAA